MNAITHISPAVSRLDAAITQRRAELARSSIDMEGGWCLKAYVNGRLLTMGYYGSPRDAQRQYPDVGRWIEVSDRLWRSDDSRVLITR